ncbi:MAG: radical SAM protein [Clostridiales bacterium]|nr:B12-binding domain-containing radical SAM protein [uncultured Anaerosporobacter sp.]MBS5933910.1 radical SAM protein [Clostridiales bacterium]
MIVSSESSSIVIISNNYNYQYKELVQSDVEKKNKMSFFEAKTNTVAHIFESSSIKIDNYSMGIPELMNYLKFGDDWYKKNPTLLYDTQNSPTLNGIFLTQYLRKNGINSEIIDNFQCEKNKLNQLLENGIRYLIISTTFITDVKPIVEICDFVKERDRQVKIIVGGPLIYNALNSESVLWSSNVKKILTTLRGRADYFINNRKGEKTLVTVLQNLMSEHNVFEIPNIIYYKDDGEYVYTDIVEEDGVIDDITLDYSQVANIDKERYLSLITSRGCVFKCNFCNYHENFPKVELKSIEVLKKELESLPKSEFKRMIRLADDNFAISEKRLVEFCQLVIRGGYNFNWSCFASHHSMMKIENVQFMAEAGCKLVFIGIESANDSILKAMNKKVTVEDFRKVIHNLKECNIKVIGSFVIGYPGENEETIENNIKFINDSGLDYYQLNLFNVMPSMQVYKQRYDYRLKGFMYGWEHGTMDSIKAAESMIHIVSSVETALTCGISDSSVQGTLEYLYSIGLEENKIEKMFQYYTCLLKENLKNKNEKSSIKDNVNLKKFAELVLDMQNNKSTQEKGVYI